MAFFVKDYAHQKVLIGL